MRKIFFLAILLLFFLSQCFSKRYTYYNYASILSKMSDLATQNPRYCKLFNAREEISYMIDTYCGESLCEHKYMIITDFDAPDEQVNALPQVLFLGGIHGDEVLGPQIVINLAEYLLENIEDPDVGRLVKSRYIILLPMANPSGFYAGKREEQQGAHSIDPNRDFPYDIKNGICFKTVCARVIHHLYKKYLIQAAITFHGGMQAIGYPWGANNHIMKIVHGRQYADECPDDKVFADIGKILSKEAGSNLGLLLKPYPVGRMTDTVYPVDGGMEDWAYSASWESEYQPGVISTCNKIPENIRMEPEDLAYGPQSVRSLVYLVETADDKRPVEAYLGTTEAFQGNAASYGHIPININLCLALADLVQPYVKVLSVEYDEVKNNLLVRWQGGGCKTVDETYLEWTNKQGAKTFKDTFKAKSGPGYYENKNFVYDETINLNNTDFQLAFTIKLTCDQSWATQVDPRPLAKIQTHVANSRTNQSYFAESNGFTISGTHVVEYTQNNIVVADFAKKRTVDLKDMDLEIQVVDCAYKNYGRVEMKIIENGDSFLMNFEGSISVDEKPLNAFLHQFGDLSRCKDSIGANLNPNTFAVVASDSTTNIPLFQAKEQAASGNLTVKESRAVPNEANLQQFVGRSVHFDAPQNSKASYLGQILPVQPASCSKDEEMSDCFGTDIGDHSAICNLNVELENTRHLVKLLIDSGVPGESITISGFISNAIMAHYDNPKEIIIINEKIETKLSLDQNKTLFINNYYQAINQGTLNLNPQFALANMLRVYVDQLGGRKLVGACSIVRRDTMFDEKAYLSRIPHTTTTTNVVEAIKTNFWSWLLLGVTLAVGSFGIYYIIKKFRKEATGKDDSSTAGFGRGAGQHIELAEGPEEGTDI